MEWVEIMTATVDYIENNLTDDIMYDEVAQIACCSTHQFGCIFSYVVGISLSEYIRRRRLTLAALDLQESNKKVIDVAMKYGYNSPAAFTRAFVGMQGIAPKSARISGVKFKAYLHITFHLSIKGDTEIEYRIEDKQEITIAGLLKHVKRQSANIVANGFHKNTREWRNFTCNRCRSRSNYFN